MASNEKEILKRLLEILPEGTWFVVHEKENDDGGIAKATGMPRLQVNALLTIIGILKETSSGGVTFKKAQWEAFCLEYRPTDMKNGNIRNQVYVGRGDLKYDCPAKQKQQGGRNEFDKAEPSESLKNDLGQATDKYNEEKDAQKKAAAAKVAAKAAAAAEAAKAFFATLRGL